MAYTQEFKKKVVDEFKQGKTITEISDKYKIAPSTVFFWNKYFENDKRYTNYPHPDTLTCTELTAKYKALEKEYRQLQLKLEDLETQVSKLVSINNKLSSIFINKK